MTTNDENENEVVKAVPMDLECTVCGSGLERTSYFDKRSGEGVDGYVCPNRNDDQHPNPSEMLGASPITKRN